jgi:gliding motility-associated-like protein
MKTLNINIVLFSFFLGVFSVKAQVNFVPNYSFEIFDTCPPDMGYLNPSCDLWFTPTSKMLIIPPLPYSLFNWGSSDYYNLCAISTNAGIPSNFVGFQNPFYGDAYAGFLLIYNDIISPNYKEYIEIELENFLQKDMKYCLEFYYSLAEWGHDTSYYPLEIGALLTDTVVYRLSGVGTNQPQNINTIPQVKQKLPAIKDTLNWIKVSGTFIAKGGERFLTIGNFQTTDTLQNKNVYVYIDDVKLYYCGPDTTQPPVVDSLIIPNIFTPNADGYNDKFEYKNQEQWNFETQVFNRWGDLVFDNKSSENWDGYYKGNKVSAGVYFYIIKAQAIKTGEVRVYKGHVTVMY